MEWEDGGLDDGGKPLWSLTSFGDTGNGFLSAIGMIGALLHRDRTGEGQFVSTSILGACLVNTSYAWVDAATGAGVPRAKVRADQLGTGPRLRLWKCADRWLCVAVTDDSQWRALAAATDVSLDGLDDDAAIVALDTAFATRTAADWFAVLDGAGVPCEIADDRFAFSLFDDPVFRDAGLVTSMHQAQVGRFEQFGALWTFSDTPSRIAGPPLVVGHDTVALLEESGMDTTEIGALLADKVVVQSDLRQERAR